VALAPPALAGGAAIAPGAPVVVTSVLTGQFCRAVDVGKRVQIICDVADVSQASEFVYTGAAAGPLGWLGQLDEAAGWGGCRAGAAGASCCAAPVTRARSLLPPPPFPSVQAPPGATRASC
jgi:hypothetical protein